MKRPEGLRIFGLTGGVASGKSTVGLFFREIGIPVIDADEIARTLRLPGGEAHDAIQARFGTADSRELRRLIFENPQAKGDLEAILHPRIQAASEKEFAKFAGKAPYVIYEAALLVEAGRHLDFDGLIVVITPSASRLERLVRRDKLDETIARQMVDGQASDEAKLAAATHVIRNDGSIDALKTNVRALHAELLRYPA